MSASISVDTSVGATLTRWAVRVLPSSLLGRLSVVMVTGVLLTQLVGNVIWGAQLAKEAQVEANLAAQHIAHSAASTVRYFLSLPVNYRPIMLDQFREMGGTRFFVNVTSKPLTFPHIAEYPLAQAVGATVGQTLKQDLPRVSDMRVAFAWPNDLLVSDSGAKINDLPDSWVQHILLVKPNPAPVLVIQTELEPGHWLYLAALMPNPHFLESGNPLSTDRLALQGLSLAAVLLLSILVVRWTTRPLAALSEAAAAFGKGESMPALPETGSREFVNTARAFSAMRTRIERYIEDRERLFVSISHDLRTPITRLKLRSELLDDEELRNEFHDDLDELDMMVKGALQCVKDSDIHENATAVRLDALLARVVKSAELAGHQVAFSASGIIVNAKPLALKRAIGNLLDNALHYGKTAEIAVQRDGNLIKISIRDHGPGVPEAALRELFDPYVRLAHGREQNQQGLGLGLGIARDIAQAHGGEVVLANHAEGGLVATICLPQVGGEEK